MGVDNTDFFFSGCTAQTRAMAVKAPSPAHWTTREFPVMQILKGSAGHCKDFGFFSEIGEHCVGTRICRARVGVRAVSRHLQRSRQQMMDA